MSTGIDNELNWQYLGSLLAQNSPQEQIEFFRAFTAEYSSWGTSAQIKFELIRVNSKLTDTERRTLRALCC